MLLHDPFERTRARFPDAIALVAGGREYSYRDLGERMDRFTNALGKAGVVRGDRVAAFMTNRAEFVVALLATSKLGAVFLPIGALTKAGKLSYYLGDSEPTCLVTEERLTPIWQEVVGRCPSLASVIVCQEESLDAAGSLQAGPVGETWQHSPSVVAFEAALAGAPAGPWPDPETIDQDLAAIIYTSGSRGDPKGVMLTHRNLRSAAGSILGYIGLRHDDVILCAMPLTFGYGLGHILIAFDVGAKVILEPSFAYPVKVLEQMERERVTFFPGVPTMFSLLMSLDVLPKLDLSALRIITNAGSAIPDARLRQMRARFPDAKIFSMYGQTECTRVTYLPPEELDRRPDSVGRGMPNQEIYLVDEAGRRLPNGSTGELVVRGSHVMRGYWRKPSETAEKLRPGELPGELVLHSGDLFRTDEEGFFYFVSRSDDVIKCRGEKVSPREVEQVLHTCEGVLEAAVFGVPDVTLGQAIKAFVVLREGASITQRDVLRHCHAHLESHMVPQQIQFIPALPKTPNSKVDKTALLTGSPTVEGERFAQHQA